MSENLEKSLRKKGKLERRIWLLWTPSMIAMSKKKFKKGKSEVRRIWQLWTPFRTAINWFWIKRIIQLTSTPYS